MSERSRRYGLLLLLLPRALRGKHGREIQELFAVRLTSVRERGRLAVAAAWARAAADVLGEAARLKWSGFQRRGRVRPHRERREVMIGSDVRYALRSLMRQKLASGLVVGMLALGIAANIAVFSLVNGLFLRPFPFPEPDRLVWLNERAPRWNLDVVGINYPDFDQWRKAQRLFESMALYEDDTFNFSDGVNAERVSGARITHDFPTVLGIRPLLGRGFTPEEDRPKAAPVVMIGEGLWRERFGASRDVLGRSLKLNGVPRTIVGVLPREAEFPGGIRLWVPMAGDPDQQGQSYGGAGFARLKAGVSVAEAEKDLLRAHAAVWEVRDKEKVVSPYARPLREAFVSDFRAAASTVSVAVALLLAVACANVASVMLARALGRRREIAIRVAVGAGRWQLLRQLFVESFVLAVAGGALGVLAGRWGIGVLLAAASDELPQWASFTLDARVAGFALAVTLMTAFLFGWAPALHALRDDLRSAMHNSASGTTASPRGRRTLWLLVGSEFALAAALLVCGGLLYQAFERVRRVEPGFRTDNVLLFSVALPDATYPTEEQRLAFWDSLVDRLEALPGVDTAGAITCAPLDCHWGSFFEAEGQPPLAPDATDPVVLYRYATSGYFRTMGLRLKSGRFFDPSDGRGGEHGERVVIVNESYVRTFWPGLENPVGRRMRFRSQSGGEPWMTVVGLVGDVKHYGFERPMRPGIYLPLPQRAAPSLTLALHTRVEPSSMAGPARALLREMDPDLALFQVRTMEGAVKASLRTRAVYSWLLGTFALLALVLALGGAYGVTSYLVTQRAREIGIRLALGARSTDVASSVLKGSLRVVAAGVALGTAGSVAAARLLSSLLFGVPPHEPLVLGGSIGLLLIAAVLANSIPAWRASRVDPMTTLRAE